MNIYDRFGLIKVNRLFHCWSEIIWMTVCLVVVLSTQTSAENGEIRRIIDLNRDWKFEIGDNPEWINPLFNDDQWEKILVPSTWEEEGFDYQNQQGIAVGKIFGFLKPQFESMYASNTKQDFGVVSVYTSYA